MKKTFYHSRVVYWILFSLLPAAFGVGIYLMAEGIRVLVYSERYEAIFVIAVGAFTAGLMFNEMLCSLHNRVIFTEEKIIVTGNIIKKAVQAKVEIYYSEIQDVAIIRSTLNSSKKRYNYTGRPMMPFTYFEFILKSGRTKWVAIMTYTKRQRKQMIEIINLKANLNLSYEEIEKKSYSTNRKKKEKSNQK